VVLIDQGGRRVFHRRFHHVTGSSSKGSGVSRVSSGQEQPEKQYIADGPAVNDYPFDPPSRHGGRVPFISDEIKTCRNG
jgi:hypothetical protein